MRRPRFTLRALMIAVALAALTTWGCVMWHRSAVYTAKVIVHGIIFSIRNIEILTEFHDSRGRRRQHLTAHEAAELAIQERVVEYEERMYQKYDRAARSPWLPVGPDPAQPACVQQ